MWRSNYAPPLLRILWRLGIRLPPLPFMPFWQVTLLMGGLWGISWGWAMWFMYWGPSGMVAGEAIIISITSGFLFGLLMAYFFIYYFVFRWTILKFNLMTVGREESSPVTLNAHEDTAIADIPTPDKSELQAAEQMVKALGGKENIKSLDNCVTRLRLTIADMGLIDEAAIKRAGGIAVVKLDQNTLQVIIGTKVIALRRDMDNYMGIY